MITRQLLKILREEIDQALKTVGEKHGLEFQAGSASFSGNNFTFKLAGSMIGEDGKAVTKEVETFKAFAKLYGLQPEDLGKEFTRHGRRFTICGLKMSAKKYPIMATRDDGERFKFPAEDVVRLLTTEAFFSQAYLKESMSK